MLKHLQTCLALYRAESVHWVWEDSRNTFEHFTGGPLCATSCRMATLTPTALCAAMCCSLPNGSTLTPLASLNALIIPVTDCFD